jgi:hypothetical protein
MKFFFKHMLKVSALYNEKQNKIFLKKKIKSLSISKQETLFSDPIFSEGFGMDV